METLISICVCTFRRPVGLLRTLQSVDRQRPQNVAVGEIVVVDNDAAASAKAIVETFAAHARYPVRYVVEPTKGLSAARNRVLQVASGDWLAFIDDDEVATQDWIEALYDCAQSHGADAVIGAVCPKFETPPPFWITRNGSFDLRLPPTGARVQAGDALTGNTLLKAASVRMRNLTFNSAFDASGGEDTDFFRRMIDLGGIVISARQAVVHEIVPDERVTSGYLARRAIRQGEIHAVITHRHGGTTAMALDMARACLNIAVASLITLACLPFGRAVYHRFYLLLVRNVGRFRYYVGLSPTLMYR